MYFVKLLFVLTLGCLMGWTIRKYTPHLLGKKDKKRPFSWPWVEILSALSFLLLFLNLPFHLSSAGWYLFAAYLIAVSSTDFLSKCIPDSLLFSGTACGLLVSSLTPAYINRFLSQSSCLDLFHMDLNMWQSGLILSLAGALLGLAMLEFLRRTMRQMTGMEVMGAGDSLLLMMIGSFIGPKMVFIAILPSSLIGIAIGLYFKWKEGAPHSPFGPALALGGFLQLLFWREVEAAIDGFYRSLYSMSKNFMVFFAFILLVVLFLLILRMKQKASEYEKQINDDYHKIYSEMEDKP
ncbi:MAG: hypothetical protein CSA81_06370 [Acidobacteria bacterium]|nr:MAG: hypothetical protein CSA81_06370 [Acidobacteriota bacterium]